jgi:hypothetical protein
MKVVHKFYKKYRSHLKILGARIVTRNNLYCKSTNIKRHLTKFSRHGEVRPGVCVPVVGDVQNHPSFRLCPSFNVQLKHNVSEAGYASVFKLEEMEIAPTLLDNL